MDFDKVLDLPHYELNYADHSVRLRSMHAWIPIASGDALPNWMQDLDTKLQGVTTSEEQMEIVLKVAKVRLESIQDELVTALYYRQ